MSIRRKETVWGLAGSLVASHGLFAAARNRFDLKSPKAAIVLKIERQRFRVCNFRAEIIRTVSPKWVTWGNCAEICSLLCTSSSELHAMFTKFMFSATISAIIGVFHLELIILRFLWKMCTYLQILPIKPNVIKEILLHSTSSGEDDVKKWRLGIVNIRQSD